MLQLHMIPTTGDATLLRFTEAENEINILIDGGNRSKECIEYLKKLRIPCIDLLIVSHLDEDHIRGLRRVVEEIDVNELWVMDIYPLIKYATESIYMYKCLLEAKFIIDGSRIRHDNKLAVYDGYEKAIGPFYLQVLSPPKSLHDYLRQPDAIKRILKSPKGKTSINYVKYLLEHEFEKQLQEERINEPEKWEEIKSKVIERFELDIPQEDEIRKIIEQDELPPGYWNEKDKFYKSARSLFNDISIVVKITYNYKGVSKSFLFPGDLTNWTIIMAKYPFLVKNCVLKVPHHGSGISYDKEYYYSLLYYNYFDPKLWKTFPFPLHHILEEWHYITQKILEKGIPFPCLPFLYGVPIQSWETEGIFSWLSPDISLIYPYYQHKLPKMNIRNEIINASNKIFCTYNQGKVSSSKCKHDSSCLDCFNCELKIKPTVLEWRGNGKNRLLYLEGPSAMKLPFAQTNFKDYWEYMLKISIAARKDKGATFEDVFLLAKKIISRASDWAIILGDLLDSVEFQFKEGEIKKLIHGDKDETNIIAIKIKRRIYCKSRGISIDPNKRPITTDLLPYLIGTYKLPWRKFCLFMKDNYTMFHEAPKDYIEKLPRIEDMDISDIMADIIKNAMTPKDYTGEKKKS